MVDKTCTMASSVQKLSPCDQWLHDLKQPCGDCHQDAPNCVHCGDCNPREFIVRLKDFKLHTSCMPFGTGVEKLFSYSIDGDYTLKRTDNGTDFFDGDSAALQDPHVEVQPSCRWATQISVNAQYLANAEFPTDSLYEYTGDLCECFTGDAMSPIKAYIEIVIGTGNKRLKCGDNREPIDGETGAVGRIRIAYEYLSDLSDGNHARDPNNWRVILFESSLNLGGSCFNGGAIKDGANLLNWVTQSSGTEERWGVPGGVRYCKGDVFWKSCNLDFFDGKNQAAYEFDNIGPDLGSWSSDEPQNLQISPVTANGPCLPCKRVSVPMKTATDEYRNRTLLLSHQKPLAMPINYADIWRGMDDSRRLLFMNMLDETRLSGEVHSLKYKKDGGHNPDYLESASDQLITIKNYGNTLEQPGYLNGRLITLDHAMVEKGLLDKTSYKTVNLAIGNIAGISQPILKTDNIKNKFIRTITLTADKAPTPPGQSFVHVFFRYNHNKTDGKVCETQKAYFHRVGPFEAVIDNISMPGPGGSGNATTSPAQTGITIEVNRPAPDFIEVVSDMFDNQGGASQPVKITQASVVVMDPKDYLNIVVPTNDYSAVWDKAGRLIVFYVDQTHRIGNDCWSSSSSETGSFSTNNSSAADSSTSSMNDCGERGVCRKRLKTKPSSKSACFTGETPIRMADGTNKKIEQIAPGELILAFDPDDNVVVVSVEDVYDDVSYDLLKITIGGRTVRATYEHPFYVGDARFRVAELLEAGDTVYVLGEDGKLKPEQVEEIIDDDTSATVFNLTASGPYTYFANEIAVHNKGGESCFTGETPISLAGNRTWPIGGITRRDTILGFSVSGEIVHTKVREMIEHVVPGFYRIETERGVLNVTGNHPFYMGNGEFRQAYKLTPDDTIYQERDGALVPAKIVEKRYVKRGATVFNMSVESPNTYFAQGIAVHNKVIGGGGGCFVAETPVVMADGTEKSINALINGEKVVAFDAEENIVVGEVTKLLPHRASDLLKITANGAQVTVTKDHPFYTTFGMYQAAELLKVGDDILFYSRERDMLDSVKIESIEPVPGSTTVWNLTVNSPNTFIAGGFAVHNKGDGGVAGDGKGGGGGGGSAHSAQTSTHNHSSQSSGPHDSRSSDSSSSSCSSFSSDSSSSIGCPHGDSDFNYNCDDVNTRAQDAITVDLSQVVGTNTFCRKCDGCKHDSEYFENEDMSKPQGLLHFDLSQLKDICLVRDCNDGTKYTGQVALSATAIGCSYACARPRVIAMAMDVTLQEEMGRWTLEVKLTDLDGKKTTIFYGSHWDSAKLKTKHCMPPDTFRVCNKPKPYAVSSCPEVCLYGYNEISALVSHDGGMTFEKHHAVVRSVGFEELTNPIAIPDWNSNKVVLMYKRSVHRGSRGEKDEKNKTWTGTFSREVPTNLFRPDDAFVDYDRPQYMGAYEPDDYYLDKFTAEGQALRQATSFLVAGEMEPGEIFNGNTRLQNNKHPRMLQGKTAPNGQPIQGNCMGYVDHKGALRIWVTNAPFAQDDVFPSTPPAGERGRNGNNDFCTSDDLSLIVSGISDKHCPCHTLMETTKLIGEHQPDIVEYDDQGNVKKRTPVPGYVKWVSDSGGRKKWTLQTSEGGWELISRNKKVKLFKQSPDSKCPPNGTYQLECGFCNGWIIGTVSGSHDPEVDTSDSQSSEMKGFTEDGSISLFTSIDGGRTWMSGNNPSQSTDPNGKITSSGAFSEWRGGRMAYVIYDEKDDTTYLFFTTPEQLLFMKVIPSGMLDSPDLLKYLDSDAGKVPIFIAGDISYVDGQQKTHTKDFKQRAYRILPDDFIMNWKMEILNLQPAASVTPQGSIRFFYVDIHGHINSGLWDGGMQQLMAKMQRRDGSESSNQN